MIASRRPVRSPSIPSRCRGISLVEALISLAIASVLLVAVGTAFQASARTIEANDDFFRASQAARVSLGQILSVIRKSAGCQIGEVANPASSTVSADTLHILDSTGEFVVYKFDADTQTLRRVEGDDATVAGNPLASHVTSATFTGVLEAYPDTGVRRITQVHVTIRTTVGAQQVEFTGSAVPRRAVLH